MDCQIDGELDSNTNVNSDLEGNTGNVHLLTKRFENKTSNQAAIPDTQDLDFKSELVLEPPSSPDQTIQNEQSPNSLQFSSTDTQAQQNFNRNMNSSFQLSETNPDNHYKTSNSAYGSHQSDHQFHQNQHVQPNHSAQNYTSSNAGSYNLSPHLNTNFCKNNPQKSLGHQKNYQSGHHSSTQISEMGLPNSKRNNTLAPEYTRISDGLADKMKKSPQNTIVPFYIQNRGNRDSGLGTSHGDSNGNSSSVRLPHSPMNKKNGSQVGNWDIIVEQLLKLRDACNRERVSKDFGTLMKIIVSNYTFASHQNSNFGMLGHPELKNDLMKTIPLIVDMALMLPKLVASPIPNLKSGESKTIYLTRQLCCSLLANAFFCTFPEHHHHHSNFPDFNFFRLYNDTNSERCKVKKEKIKCMLEYFRKYVRLEENYKYQIVSFERRCIQQRVNWAQSDKHFCKVHVDKQKRIEQADGMLQFDFANKLIGGGVLSDGSVMEEIRFCISPELIVARLFTEAMNDNEVVVTTGSMICSEYTGYSTSFKFKGSFRNQNFQTDKLGRTYTQVVAIDALSFNKHDSYKQYHKSSIDRELHKCYVALIHGKNRVTRVATGNWGCGAFNGDPDLKFLIQWIAASHQDRGLLQYHLFDDLKLGQDIIKLYDFIISNKVKVGDMYKTIVKFNGNGSIFKHVKDNLKGSIFNKIKKIIK